MATYHVFLSVLVSLTFLLSLTMAATPRYPFMRVTGPLETVFNISAPCPGVMPSGLPIDSCDSMPLAFAAQGETYLISAASYGVHAFVGPSLGAVEHQCDRVIFNSTFNNTPESYANYGWIQSVTALPNGTLVALVHNEFHGWQVQPPLCNITDHGSHCNMWSTGLAISDDGGRNFRLTPAPPAHLVAAMPFRYVPDQPSFGYGAVSSLLPGDDGAYYGLINMVGYGPQASGDCPIRTDNLLDPQAYRGWNGSAYSVRFASAYGPGPAGGVCQPLPAYVSASHPSLRRIVGLPGGAAAGWPSFVHLSIDDQDGPLGRCNYAYAHDTDFARAITDWGSTRKLDLGVDRYMHHGGRVLYTSLLDESSPAMGAATAAPVEGNSYTLLGNTTSYIYFVLQRSILRRRVYFSMEPPPPPPPPLPPAPTDCSTFSVTGAGIATVNGRYVATNATTSDGLPIFAKDSTHALYRFEGVWRLAQHGVPGSVYYIALQENTTRPPPENWRYEMGLAPSPETVLCDDA